MILIFFQAVAHQQAGNGALGHKHAHHDQDPVPGVLPGDDDDGEYEYVTRVTCQGNATCECWTKAGKNCYLYPEARAWDGLQSSSGTWSGARQCAGETRQQIYF